MSYFDDAVNAVLLEANRDSNDDRKLVVGKIVQTIEDINRSIADGVLRAEKSIDIVSGTETYDLPPGWGSVIVLGKYNATLNRITEEWRRITDSQHVKRYEFNTSSTGGPVAYMFVGPGSNGLERIRVIPKPTASFTARVIYYAHLTRETVERLKWTQPLVNGAKRQLPSWFPSGFLKAESDYRDDLGKLKKRRATNPMTSILQHPAVHRANAMLRRV